MKTQILIWTNKMTGEIRREERVQINARLWKSKTDNRYYTLGIIGWYDVTDNYKAYL